MDDQQKLEYWIKHRDLLKKAYDRYLIEFHYSPHYTTPFSDVEKIYNEYQVASSQVKVLESKIESTYREVA